MSIAGLDLAQTRAIAALLRLAPRGWKRLFVDYEIQDLDHQMVCSPIAFAVVKPLLGSVSRADLYVASDYAAGEALIEVGKLVMAAKNNRCVTMDIIVRSRSDAEWFFDSSPPPRVTATLRGDLTAEFRKPEMKKPYRKYADKDEWLAQIP